MKASKYVSPKNATGPSIAASKAIGSTMPGPISPAHEKPSYTPAPVPREQNDEDNSQTGGNFQAAPVAVGAGSPVPGLDPVPGSIEET